AQLVRAPRLHRGCRGFESLRAHSISVCGGTTSVADRTHEMRRRYTSLGLGELCAAGVFAAVAVAQPIPLAPPATLALWCALGPLLAVLLQAGVYWLLARRWVGRAAMPARAARGYRWARVLDPVLLAVGLVGIVLARPT